MNLYFRLIWVVVRSFFRSRIDFADEIVINFMILPNDVDINCHLNNGRCLTILDLGSIELFLRSGIFFRAIHNGYRPMIGGIIVTYRKGLAPFERCTLSMQLAAWDERWNYFKFEFTKINGKLCATGYFKGALVSKSGFVPNIEADTVFGYERGSCNLPSAVKSWIAAENDIFIN